MKMPSAPPSLSTRSDSSSSSDHANSEVTRPNSVLFSPDRASFSPRFTSQEHPELGLDRNFRRRAPPLVKLTSVPGFIKRLLHRVECEVDLGGSNRQRRRKAHDVFGVERPVDDNAARYRRRDKSMRRVGIAELDTD